MTFHRYLLHFLILKQHQLVYRPKTVSKGVNNAGLVSQDFFSVIDSSGVHIRAIDSQVTDNVFFYLTKHGVYSGLDIVLDKHDESDAKSKCY
jgi:hypothetical protein